MILDGTIGSVQLKTDDLTKIVAAFEAQAKGVESAYVVPSSGGWTSLYPRDADSSRAWAEFLSAQLKLVTVSLQILEEEVFAYQLFDKGQLLDEFASKPAYHFGDCDSVSDEKIDALRGKPEAWEPFLINGREVSDIGKLLRSGFDDPRAVSTASAYVIAHTIMEDLCKMVGIVGADQNYHNISDEIQEWQEDAELADDDEEADAEFGVLSCGRHARDVVHVRAPRRAQKTTG